MCQLTWVTAHQCSKFSSLLTSVTLALKKARVNSAEWNPVTSWQPETSRSENWTLTKVSLPAAVFQGCQTQWSELIAACQLPPVSAIVQQGQMQDRHIPFKTVCYNCLKAEQTLCKGNLLCFCCLRWRPLLRSSHLPSQGNKDKKQRILPLLTPPPVGLPWACLGKVCSRLSCDQVLGHS